MAVEVKHPLDSASTDLLEVSRHRLEPLSTKMEERDADVMKVSLRRVSLTIACIDSNFKTADTFYSVNSFFARFIPSPDEVLFALLHLKYQFSSCVTSGSQPFKSRSVQKSCEKRVIPFRKIYRPIFLRWLVIRI